MRIRSLIFGSTTAYSRFRRENKRPGEQFVWHEGVWKELDMARLCKTLWTAFIKFLGTSPGNKHLSRTKGMFYQHIAFPVY